MAKGSHRDASSHESCNEMREHRWKDEKGLSMVSQRRGKQHQRRLNSDPTQGDAIPNLSRNLRKKKRKSATITLASIEMKQELCPRRGGNAPSVSND
uniref:Uncharacterized protein n=1 Tax=Brassica oleracea var. oleracea TaxID=109376 RepID=A0A0D3CUT5_BRAOL